MHGVLFSLMVILAPAPKTPNLDDGFYEILDKGSGTHFTSNDGRELLLGKRVGKQFGTAAIHSRNNDNTDFGVTLKGAEKMWDGPAPLPLALVVDNVCLRLSGNTIPNADDTRDLWFNITGKESASKVAKALKCELKLRQDPGHRLSVKWSPDQGVYQIGDAIALKFEIKNTGKDPVTFRIGGSQRGSRDNQFRFVAQHSHGSGKGVPDTGDPNNFGGLSWTKTLKPGESYTADVPLNKWFKFEEADTYRVSGMWSLHLEDPERAGFDHGIWDDVVCGECYVKVEKAKK